MQDFICSASDGEFVFYLTSSSSPSVFTTFKVDDNLQKPTQYKQPVQMNPSKISTIQSMLLLRNDKGDDYYQFILGDARNRTWIAEVREGR